MNTAMLARPRNQNLKCPYRQIFLLAMLNLGMISIISVQKFFDLVKSFVFYDRLKLAFDGPCPSFLEPGTSTFCDVIQGSQLLALVRFNVKINF